VRFLGSEDLALLLRVRAIASSTSAAVVAVACWEAEDLVERWKKLRTDRKVSLESVRAHLEAAIRLADAEASARSAPTVVH
jgi:hypothetical protein